MSVWGFFVCFLKQYVATFLAFLINLQDGNQSFVPISVCISEKEKKKEKQKRYVLGILHVLMSTDLDLEELEESTLCCPVQEYGITV